jgi:protein-tyrosine phosphatase
MISNEGDRMTWTAPLDAHEIMPGLWQGSVPDPELVKREGFHLVVFCASEFQPAAREYPSVAVLYAPNEDHAAKPTPRPQLERASRASKIVAAFVKSGRKVLVTCFAGLNRSGLVTGLAVYRLTGQNGRDVVELVRARRPGALRNPRFVEVLRQLPKRDSGV